MSISYIALALAMQDCNFFYDEPDNKSGADSTSFTCVDATAYNSWTYISLRNHSSKVEEMGGNAVSSTDWDLAIHRYDCMTNKGAVCETNFNTIEDFMSAGTSRLSGNYTKDIWTTDKVICDISGMLDNKIIYAQTNINPTLSKWMNVDISTMPPAYKMSGKVYILRMSDGMYAVIHFSDFMNGLGIKGYISFDYELL